MKQRSSQGGFAYHLLAPLLVMGLVVAIGIRILIVSHAATANGILAAGQSLSAGQNLYSTTQNMRLAMQIDGNLVIYTASNRAVWNSGTYGTGSANRLTMQTDGNLVIYTAGNKAVWASHTYGTGSNNYLAMQTDGNLVIYTAHGKVAWSSGTYGAGTSTHSNPLAGDTFYVMPYQNNPAAQAAAANPSEAVDLDVIATQPTAYWITPQSPDSLNQTYVDNLETAASAANQVPVFVMYAIPDRDCGLYSSGGEANDAAYKNLVNYVKNGIGGRKAVVIIEPDSLTELKSCLNNARQADRLSLLKYASDTLSVAGTSVYIDAGNAFEQGTIAASQAYMLPLLEQVDISKDAGFELDTSVDQYTSDEQQFGEQMVKALASAGIVNKGYTIDTSRNGNGPGGNPLSAYCNLPGLALGARPTSSTDDPLNDAYLWVKYPGQSDGACEGSGVSDPANPPSGVFWPAYAIGLVKGNSP